jgi:hypothetical protein
VLWAYLALFLVLNVLGLREDARRGRSLAYLLLCASTGLALSVGLAVAATGIRDPGFLRLWRWVASYAAVTFVIELGHDVMTYRHEGDGTEDPETLRRWETVSIVGGTILGLVVFLPAVWINLALAFGRY